MSGKKLTREQFERIVIMGQNCAKTYNLQQRAQELKESQTNGEWLEKTKRLNNLAAKIVENLEVIVGPPPERPERTQEDISKGVFAAQDLSAELGNLEDNLNDIDNQVTTLQKYIH